MIAINEILAAWARERPDLDVSPMGVIGRLARVAAKLDSEISADHARYGLDAGSFDVLFTLVRSGAPYSLSPSALAASSMVTTAAVAQRLNRLDAAGLIRRKPNPDDARGRIVTLTPEGKALADRALLTHLAAEESFLAPLDSDQRARLSELLDRLLGDGSARR